MERKSSFGEIAANSLWTGAVATAATTATAAICGRIENRSALAPINAVSHIVWGDRAARHSESSVKYTVPGLLLNAAAVTSWAAVQELLFGRRKRRSVGAAVAEGAAVSALAYVTDYHAVPDRLTPGFEKRLSNKSLATIYGVLALSLGVGALMRRR